MKLGRFERRLIGRRVGRHFLIALTVGITFAGGRYVIGVQDPGDVPIPAPIVLDVNAFDDYKRAGEMVRTDSRAISQAAKMGDPYQPDVPGLEASELLTRHRDALTILRAGFDKPCRMPTVRDFSTLVPYYTDFRALGQLLVLEGKEKEARGDIAGAAQSYRDAVRFGTDISQGGPIIGHLVSLAVGTMGRKALWNLLPRMDGETAKETASFLESIADRQAPIVEALEEEKYGGQTMLLTVFRTPNRVFTQDFSPEGGSWSDGAMRRALPFIYMRWSKREILNNYNEYMDSMIAQARQPYHGRIPEPDFKGTDPLTAILTPVFSGAQFTYTRARTDHALLMTECAIHAYRNTEHRLDAPATLAELVSTGFLKNLPEDPFANGEPLRYQTFPGGIYNPGQAYSVGPDQQDDEGAIIDNKGRPGDHHAVQVDSKGDMVAGINH
jgi:hypothetical protein